MRSPTKRYIRGKQLHQESPRSQAFFTASVVTPIMMVFAWRGVSFIPAPGRAVVIVGFWLVVFIGAWIAYSKDRT